MHRVKEIVAADKHIFPVKDGRLIALPTDLQESQQALGDIQHDDSLDTNKWDLQPHLEGNDAPKWRESSSSSSSLGSRA